MKPMQHSELRMALEHLGSTQEDLAQTLCVSPRTMRKWLVTGVTNPPAAMYIRNLIAQRGLRARERMLTIGYGGK